MGVKILSLFDGMACGMIAMQLAGVEVESYDAYEIDKYAIKTAQHNFPMIKEHGDVFDADFTQYEGVDFLIGGSPCTYWSIAQTKNRETVASGMGWELFSQYVRALHEAKPKYFIYENNKSMSKDIRASIDKAFGFEAVLINSALVSAQNRQRLYWVGRRNENGTYSKVNVEQPADRGILLKDVLDSIEKSVKPLVAEPVCLRYELTEEAKRCRKAYEAHEIKHGYNELNELHPRPDGKTNTLTTVLKDNQIMEPICVAERGRMYCGQPQHYEARTDGKNNTLTSVEKDNRVAEPINCTADGKSQTIKAQYANSSLVNFCCYTSTYGATGVAEPINDIYQVGSMPRPDGEISTSAGFRIYSTEAKGRYLCANGGGAGAKTGLYAIPYSIEFDDGGRPIKAIGKDGKEITIYEVRDGKITIKGKQYPIKLRDGYYIIRKLTVSECKRLQTVPEWYEFPVSNSQAYKMLGNGWTCEVIAHLIRSCMAEQWGGVDG